jgi:peptidoglycan/LPS O-acetylase OafA/YrhL
MRERTTLEHLLQSKGSGELNNFTLIRLIAALLVLYGHSFFLAAPCASCIDITRRFLNYHYSGDLGLFIFFVVSGFFVTMSMDRAKSLSAFAISRALRILPGLLTFILVSAFAIAPFYLTVDLSEYLKSDELKKFIWINFTLQRYWADLPVDLGGQFPKAIAGPLWTLWIEVRLYFIVAIIGSIGLLSNKWFANTAIASIVLLTITLDSGIMMIGSQDFETVSIMAAFFASGAFLYINRSTITINLPTFILLTISTYLCRKTPYYEYFFSLSLVYGVMLFGFAKKIALSRFIDDYSFGIYLYGWILQKIYFSIYPYSGPYMMTIVCSIASIIVGALSWHLVEKRALTLRNRFKSKSVQTIDSAK